MFVDKDVVETARMVRNADPSDLFDGVRVRKPRHIEDDRAQVAVWTLGEFKGLHDVVASVPLEIFDIHPAPIKMQILIFETPSEQDLRRRRSRQSGPRRAAVPDCGCGRPER